MTVYGELPGKPSVKLVKLGALLPAADVSVCFIKLVVGLTEALTRLVVHDRNVCR